jgi:hypothetical protein
MHIIEKIQKNLGFSGLEKIDPNTQETVGPDNPLGNNALAQAGIPAVLLGIYNRLETDPSGDVLTPSDNLLVSIFGKSKDTVLTRISEYAKNKDVHREQELEHIAKESVRVIKEEIGEDTSENSIRNFVSKNKPEVLLYLPPSLELGTLFENNNLDDRTGKMEGPVSSFMHRMEKSFNTSSSS